MAPVASAEGRIQFNAFIFSRVTYRVLIGIVWKLTSRRPNEQGISFQLLIANFKEWQKGTGVHDS